MFFPPFPHAPPVSPIHSSLSIIFFLFISWPHAASILMSYPEDKGPPHFFHPSVLTVPPPSSVTFSRPQRQCHGCAALKSNTQQSLIFTPPPTVGSYSNSCTLLFYVCVFWLILSLQPCFLHILLPWFFFKLFSP